MARDAEPRMSHAARGSEMDNPLLELPSGEKLFVCGAGDGNRTGSAGTACGPLSVRYTISMYASFGTGRPLSTCLGCPRRASPHMVIRAGGPLPAVTPAPGTGS